LISDNNSSDKTREVCQQYQDKKRNYKLTYIKRDFNITGTMNFVYSLLESSGYYVWILADDDPIFDDAIKYLYGALKKNTGADIVFINYCNPLGKTAINPINNDRLLNTLEEFVIETMFSFSLISSLCFKKSNLNEEKLLSRIKNEGQYPQMYWVFDILINHSSTSLTISKPLFKQEHPGVYETRKHDFENVRSNTEHKIDNYIKAHIDFIEFLHTVKGCVSKISNKVKIYRLSIDQNLNQIIFHKITSVNYDFKSIKYAVKNMVIRFYMSPSFWIFHLPILLFPSFLAKFIEPYRWKYLEFRSKILQLFKT
jgi:glycosyltransferase involved in cell wall biosynthesis